MICCRSIHLHFRYRVNLTQGTHFRIWVTSILKEYIIKGFTMDDERLKNPNIAQGIQRTFILIKS